MEFCFKIDPATWQEYMAARVRGRRLLEDPLTNKGTAFSARERQELGLHGLLPPAISSMEQQLERTYRNFSAETSDIDRFTYLADLHDRNETLFFRLLYEHIEEMMPIVYTPVVGEACRHYSTIYKKGRGLYVSYNQRHDIESVLRNGPVDNPSVIVVTDGERILGLGDQGIGGMGIPIGKLVLYTLCAGISPYSVLPIILDVGTDNKRRLGDPLYLGLRHERIRGAAYQEFIDSFVAAVKNVYPDVLLQWEDFKKGNAIDQLARFRDELCTFNDDIQGTAGVVLAGMYSALRINGQAMRDQRVLFAGAGASAQGIANLIISALVEDGLTPEDARRRIWTVDSRGLVTQARPNLEAFKAAYARDVDEIAEYDCEDRERITLAEAIGNAKPTILIGTSGTSGVFTEEVVREMARLNERPIIFPISNPTSKCECKPEDCIRWSEGRAIIATGSPFPPVEYEGQRYRIGQGNNAFVFPGIGLGVTISQARRVTDGMFLDAAKALAGTVTAANLEETSVYPDVTQIRECSHAVACATARRAVADGHADEEILKDLDDSVSRAMWFPEYLPVRYES